MRSRWRDIGQVIFLRVYGPGLNTHKKKLGHIKPSLTEQTWSIKDSGKFFLQDAAGSPERASCTGIATSGLEV